MFTGIIEAVGEVLEIGDRDEIREIRIGAPEAILAEVSPGDSVAVDGACLTPTRIDPGSFTVEAIGTTLGRTVAGGYGAGTRVNLERALAFGGRLDGHLVQGHVDGIGHLKSVREEGAYRLLEFGIPSEVHRLTLLHGSIALNGISLTVNRLLEKDRIEVGVISHTWAHTNLSHLEPGDPVNVEGDLIGKYVGTVLRRSGLDPSGPSS
jgi:riboflavin synthase